MKASITNSVYVNARLPLTFTELSRKYNNTGTTTLTADSCVIQPGYAYLIFYYYYSSSTGLSVASGRTYNLADAEPHTYSDGSHRVGTYLYHTADSYDDDAVFAFTKTGSMRALYVNEVANLSSADHDPARFAPGTWNNNNSILLRTSTTGTTDGAITGTISPQVVSGNCVLWLLRTDGTVTHPDNLTLLNQWPGNDASRQGLFTYWSPYAQDFSGSVTGSTAWAVYGFELTTRSVLATKEVTFKTKYDS